TYSDSCAGTTLTEYGINGASYITAAYNCELYENAGTNYCSANRYYKREWGCSSSPGYCNDAAVADTGIGTNADGDAMDSQCGDSLCDNANGVYDSTKTATEAAACADNLDNDCDGLKDGADSDCAITLTLTPNPSYVSSAVTATVSGNIAGAVTIKDYLGCASGTVICSGNGCTFTSPSAANSYGYYACTPTQSISATLTTIITPHCSASASHAGSDTGTGNYAHTYSVVWSVENCAAKTSLDTDGSSAGYTTAGQLIDYLTCSSGACTSTTYSDSCAGTTLTEYGINGASYITAAYNCELYENAGTNYCSANRYYKREWGCSGTPGLCNDAAVADTLAGTNADGDTMDSQCGDSLCDNANGVYDNTKQAAESSCADGLDNDCDGLIDVNDLDCKLSLSPNPAEPVNVITASIPQAAPYPISIRDYRGCSYAGADGILCSFTSPAKSCTFSAPTTGGTFGYYSCTGTTQLDNKILTVNNQSHCALPLNHAFNDAGAGLNGHGYNSSINAWYRITKETTCDDTLDNDCDGLTDCLDLDCNGQQGCCTTITRDCKLYTSTTLGGQTVPAKDIFAAAHRIFFTSGNDFKSITNGYTSTTLNAIASQIEGSNYYQCAPNFNDQSCCASESSCVFNGVCYPDNFKGDIDNDGIAERCVAHSPGQWIEEFETDCANSVDDDLDGNTDCGDTDCNGVINGTVLDKNTQQHVDLADVQAKQSLQVIGSDATDTLGAYSISLNCGTYDLAVSHPSYAIQTKSGLALLGRQKLTQDFNMIVGTSCESDCTYVFDDIVHAECDGINGCSFSDPISRIACDKSKVGWLRDYNSTHYVLCPSGSPQPKVDIQASVNCASGTLIKSTSIVTYKGEPVKLVVVTCG
ncbi:MAG: carboxypeptidase-like regulatory domain-containing protein, partial [Nanoarchaeota archaeon]